MKTLKITHESARYLGAEPIFAKDVVKENRKVAMLHSFNWYNYNFGSKDAHQFVVDYLKDAGRSTEAKLFKKLPDNIISGSYGFLARMTAVGWVLSEDELLGLENVITTAIGNTKDNLIEPVINTTNGGKLNIQERMREKASEAGGEMEGLIDEYIHDGCPVKYKYSPINILKAANILPGHVGPEIEHFESVRAEFNEAHSHKDPELNEGYKHLTKKQLKNLCKFLDVIIADYNSYVTFKKATKTRPKRIIKTPEQITRKLQFLRNFKELNLVSDIPSKLVGAKEVFAYNTKTRKLIYIVADFHAGGSLTVKNSTIQCFDSNQTVQKTVRKPKEQIKEFMSASLPKKRKLFMDIKTTEIKFSGRFNDHIIILKVV